MQNAKIKVRAFTLIEMLVVIGVIGILAGILLGVLPAAQRKGIRGRVKTEMAAIDMAIKNYKAKNNFFPPDNKLDVARPQLFYELTGTIQETQPPPPPIRYKSIYASADPALTETDLKALFGVGGFLNSAPAPEESDVPIFHKIRGDRQVRHFPAATLPEHRLLAAPRQGMDGQPAVWRYATGPGATNNPGEFDLWAEIEIGGKKIVIGNWEK